MYYHAFDLQAGDLFETGRNSETKQECIDDIISFLVEDKPEEFTGQTDEDILNGFGVSIEETENKL